MFLKRILHSSPYHIPKRSFAVDQAQLGFKWKEHRLKSCTIRQIMAFSDNYVYFVNDHKTKTITAVDPGQPVAIYRALKAWKNEPNWRGENGVGIDYILNTHHHHDHTGGNVDLKKRFKCKVIAFEKDAHRIPEVDIQIQEGTWTHGSQEFEVMHLPGHTMNDVAFLNRENNFVFTGDVLFACGTGRLFEGTPKMLHDSLAKLKSTLKEDTLIFCGHEYSVSNTRFASTVEQSNQELQDRYEDSMAIRDSEEWCCPFDFGVELRTNPFFRLESEEIRKNDKLKLPVDEEYDTIRVVKELRRAKDSW